MSEDVAGRLRVEQWYATPVRIMVDGCRVTIDTLAGLEAHARRVITSSKHGDLVVTLVPPDQVVQTPTYRRARLREAMRHAMPLCAAFVDDIEANLGPVEIVVAQENRIRLERPDRARKVS